MNYWLMKSEPETFGIDDLKKRPKQIEPWDGVRNYQARNTLRDGMKIGDQAFFYHSSCETPGVVGIMEIVRAGYPDSSAFDPADPHFDPKSDPKNPRWYRVDVRFVRKLKRTISLAELKSHKALASFPLLQRGNRLSVLPVTPQQWKFILSLE
ncbi:MAG TPA: EVE domain-containing protein [Gammaproteobacteria bacterium]|nr:EVE domain-containing protein [Gammaproteobacteria bacterium]